MNAAEIREKSDAELKDLLAQTREDLFRLRMQLHTGQLEKPTRVQAVRRDIARIETILRERELSAAS
jgi:large subunit ribosomal protein L29